MARAVPEVSTWRLYSGRSSLVVCGMNVRVSRLLSPREAAQVMSRTDGVRSTPGADADLGALRSWTRRRRQDHVTFAPGCFGGDAEIQCALLVTPLDSP